MLSLSVIILTDRGDDDGAVRYDPHVESSCWLKNCCVMIGELAVEPIMRIIRDPCVIRLEVHISAMIYEARWYRVYDVLRNEGVFL